MMNRYVCIHGHFYQPPRENPWLEDVELQDSAYPYHDWNDKITEECYRQNAASRILGPDKKIIDIVSNYSKISSDFGPTLLYWLERGAPEVYESIIEADKKSRELFSGHGAAIAQVYNHIIMPLANRRDKETEVLWGIYDFEYRFGRRPEGMWLPETAVDLETLEILSEQGIEFTILSPRQARRVRKIGAKQWKSVEAEKIDTTRAYLCRLSSGRTINLFFYHGPTALGAAGGSILQNGEIFARKLTEILDKNPKEPQLAHIATDGETYGHHHRHTDMALAYCIHYIESNELAKITVYGEYLEKFPPTYEVEICEDTSWSCSHGIERWRSNCGCCYGRYPSGRQQWRGVLREAMDWLRDRLAGVYEDRVRQYVSEPWELRNRYITVINDRSFENVENFFSHNIERELSDEEKVALMKLLEMERDALLMYTSCGWFFDDICGMETVQIMEYAARAMQLAAEVSGEDFEPEFKEILSGASTNVKKFVNGKEVYGVLVQPSRVDLNRVGAHLAMSSLFEKYPEKIDIYCYLADIELYDRIDVGDRSLATGRANLRSRITLEEYPIDFAVLRFGDRNLIGAVDSRKSDDEFFDVRIDVEKAFRKGDTSEVMRLMNTCFSGNNYTLWHLFRDEQQRILYQLLETTWLEIEASFRRIYERNYTIMQMMRGMNIFLPKALSTPAEFVLNQDLCRVIQKDEIDLERLQVLVDEANKLSLQLDEETLRFVASHKVRRFMDRLENSPEDVELLEMIEVTIKILMTLVSDIDVQTAQNIFFNISKEKYPQMERKADMGELSAKKWLEHFGNLAHHLGVRLQW